MTRGISISNLGTNPSTTPFFERGLHLNYSRWFYRTRPTLIGHLQKIAGGLIQFEGLRLPGVIGGLPARTPTGTPVAYKSKVGSFQGS